MTVTRRNRFAGWLCVCLLLLQALAIGCHEFGSAPAAQTGAGYAAATFICSASGSPVQPGDGPQKAPVKRALMCTCHVCGCCPAILTETAGLPRRLEPVAARIAGHGSIGFPPTAILGNPSVRGPPAFLA